MSGQNKFGTFGGVFVPSILTILGVIMYLRLPMIVGESGLWATIGIIVVAHIISFTTGLSVSSIATDKKVEAGGTYFMISRSLGLPIGGTLGLALFVGLSFSVSLYLIGFSESFLNYWNFSNEINNIRITGTIVLIAVTTLTFISTSLAIKTQYFIMAAIGLSLISIVFGKHDLTPEVPLFINTGSTVSLMVLFGIFFPAVTGFEAGVSMSGDLKDAKKSIPSGSIAAIVVGFIVYIALAFFFSYTVDGKALVNDPQVLLKISWIPELVIAGIWGATLSSALGSILGAPRILQATAKDRISPKIFEKGYGPTNEPRNALLLTFVIAEAGILIGELDVIARVVSIFFITTYGFLNISATFERYTSSDFRPEFKIPGWVSMIGALACILVMIQLDLIAMLGAILILGLLFLYLKRQELSLDSGDAWSGFWASLVKRGLTNLKRDKLHKRNWRPNIIMFSGNPQIRDYMVEIGKVISGHLGILSAFELIESDSRILAKSVSGLTKDKDDIGYFNHELYCKEVYSAMDQIARVYGFSGIEPNTILMGWSTNPRNKQSFTQLLESFNQNNYNTLFLKYDHEKKFGNHKSIDIWWSGASRNLDLGINIIRYITNSILWKNAKVRVLIINKSEDQEENIYKATDSIISNYRIDAEIKIINNEINPISEGDLISKESQNTDLSIIGIPDKKFQNLTKYYDSISEILKSNGTSLVINSSNDFEHMEVLPEEIKKQLSIESSLDFTMKPLLLSRYNELNVELRKLDAQNEELIKEFIKKSFKPIINDRLAILNDLLLRVDSIKKEIEKIEEIPDTYRRKKLVDKLKNETFFKLNIALSKENTEKFLEGQTKLLADSIRFYTEGLVNNVENSPKSISLICDISDFEIEKNDSFSMRLYKRSKRLKYKINGKPIKHNVQFKSESKHFQIDVKKEILYSQIEQFRKDEELFYKDIRHIVNLIISRLDNTEREIWQELDNLIDTAKYTEIEKFIIDEIEKQSKTLESYRGKFLHKFRETLQEMFKDLSSLNSRAVIKNKRIKSSFLKNITDDFTIFPERRTLIIRTLVNMILMELSINATKNRIEMLLEEFELDFKMAIENKFYKQIDYIIDSQREGPTDVDIQDKKLNDNFEIEIQELFSIHLEKIIALTDHMPDELNIYSFKGNSTIYSETLSIPVSRMTEYYLKSQYEVIVEDYFNKLMEFIKGSLFSINEHLNLTQFNIENITSKDFLKEKSSILVDLSLKLEQEIKYLNEETSVFFTKSEKQLESAFEPLSSIKIEESATEFVTGLRNYQSKKVLTGISRFTQHIKELFKRGITMVLYSRSEGILYAKKLSNSGDLESSISKILDFKDKVTPSQNTLNTLPPYYVTLFNGKSNIGKDFWINRKEESLFLKAVARYEEGYGGGILLLGDRNSGKTSFCRYVSQQYLKSVNTYNLFSPVQGINSVAGFNQVLSKATQINGDTDQILSQIAPGSVIVINDLELFWERHDEGLNVVHHLERIIDDYGQRLLFIVNMNPHAYLLLNQITHLADKFIEIINFRPFDAKDLKELILKRHRSSGLTIGFNANNSLNEVQLAQLFNSYFDYSEGNPGSALNGWLSNIIKNSKDQLIITKPAYPPISFIKNLSEDWLMILAQFILHKRLTHDKIKRITKWEDEKIRSQLLGMLRSGILNEKASGIFHINPFIHPFVIKALKEIDVLK